MAYISNEGNIIDENDDFKKVDIKFNRKTPYFYSDSQAEFIEK